MNELSICIFTSGQSVLLSPFSLTPIFLILVGLDRVTVITPLKIAGGLCWVCSVTPWFVSFSICISGAVCLVRSRPVLGDLLSPGPRLARAAGTADLPLLGLLGPVEPLLGGPAPALLIDGTKLIDPDSPFMSDEAP